MKVNEFLNEVLAAAKAAGINGSVFTSPLSRNDATRKTLLGQ